MVMILQLIATGSGYCVKLMILQSWQHTTRNAKRIVELIIWIVHLIDAEHGFQTAFVKGLVVCYERQTFYQRFYLLPYFRENRCVVCVITAQTVYLTTPVIIIVWLRLDERVEGINYLTIPNDDDTNRANTTALIVRSFEIYCCKIFEPCSKIFALGRVETSFTLLSLTPIFHFLSFLYLSHIIFILLAISSRKVAGSSTSTSLPFHNSSCMRSGVLRI